MWLVRDNFFGFELAITKWGCSLQHERFRNELRNGWHYPPQVLLIMSPSQQLYLPCLGLWLYERKGAVSSIRPGALIDSDSPRRSISQLPILCVRARVSLKKPQFAAPRGSFSCLTFYSGPTPCFLTHYHPFRPFSLIIIYRPFFPPIHEDRRMLDFGAIGRSTLWQDQSPGRALLQEELCYAPPIDPSL
jgi:hypothetical protein